MKTRILYLLGVLMMVSTVEASTSKEQPNSKWDYGYHEAEPISFKERGIKFYIFPDGEMDFDIHANEQGTTTEYYYRGSRNNARGSHQRGTRVVRDYRGRVIRIGRVFINYNYRGKISRVGSVFISYRRNLMTKVGGLRILYDRYGDVRYVGRVKHNYYSGYYNNYYYNNHYHSFFNDYFFDDFEYSFDDNFFDDDNFFNEYEQFEEDDDYYYYRSKGNKTKIKNGKKEVKKKMIKRKKRKGKSETRSPKKLQRRGK